MTGSSLMEALKESNSGLRVLVYLSGVFVSIIVTAFFAGGIWWEVRGSVQQQQQILHEIKEMRRDMNVLDGLMSRFRVQFDTKVDEIERRVNRLEQADDRSWRRRQNGG